MTSQKRVYLFLLNLISKLCRWKGLDLRSKILKNVRCHDHYISSYSKLNVFFAAPRNLLNHTVPVNLIILLLFSTVLSMRLENKYSIKKLYRNVSFLGITENLLLQLFKCYARCIRIPYFMTDETLT